MRAEADGKGPKGRTWPCRVGRVGAVRIGSAGVSTEKSEGTDTEVMEQRQPVREGRAKGEDV